MSETILIALIGAASAAGGYVVSYLTTKRTEQRQANTAELNYMVRLQEMLVDGARRLTDAGTVHAQQLLKIEREKYCVQEDLRQLKAEYERCLIYTKDQENEIAVYIAEQKLFEQEINRLNGILKEFNVPIVEFILPKRHGDG